MLLGRQLSLLVLMLVEGGYIEGLVMDKFGNYFMQTLLANVDRDSFNRCVDSLTQNRERFTTLCTHQFGSHVIQAAINLSGGNLVSSTALAKRLCENITPIASHFLGSICLLHAIEILKPAKIFCSAVARECRPLSFSRHGHLVMTHALQRFDDDFVNTIGEHALQSFDSFMSDDFGYRVVIQVLKELQVRRLARSSFIAKLVGLVKFSARYYPIIEYLVINFPNHDQVRLKLIPAIVRIVEKGRDQSRNKN